MLGAMRATLLALATLIAGCIIQQPQEAQQPMVSQGQGSPGAGTLPAAGPRNLSFNGHAATEQDLATLDQLEQQWGARVPDGAYWYDNVSGAAGPWGGPTGGMLPAGLGLGGALPANASGGGDGTLTNVFINGRELHPQDVYALQQLVGAVYEGRWFVDAYGNFGQEGGPVLGNLVQLAQQYGAQSGGGGDSYYSSDANGSAFVGGGCVSATSKNAAGETTGAYYGAGC